MPDKEHKFQVSWKYDNGVIALVRADTREELETNYNEAVDFCRVNGLETDSVSGGVAASNNTGLLTIPVDSIEFDYTADNGATCWKVRGGWATKFGLSVWEEVLVEAGVFEHLEREGENKPAGVWEAVYEEWEKDGKKKRKVKKLVKK